MKLLRLVWKELRFADIVLIAIVIICIVVSGQYFARQRNDNQVYVSKDNQLFGVYALSQDKVVEIDEHNTIEIKAGKVRMLKADCPNKHCLKQGWTDNLPIICAYNRVIVEVKSDAREKRLILQ